MHRGKILPFIEQMLGIFLYTENKPRVEHFVDEVLIRIRLRCHRVFCVDTFLSHPFYVDDDRRNGVVLVDLRWRT